MAFRRTTELPRPAMAPARTPKAADQQHDVDLENEPISSFRVLLARVIWCCAGPILLTLWAIRIATSHDGWIAPSDIGFLAALGIVIGARWHCYSSNDRTDMQGNPTSIDQLYQYTRTWAVGGVVVWVLANLIGNFVAR